MAEYRLGGLSGKFIGELPSNPVEFGILMFEPEPDATLNDLVDRVLLDSDNLKNPISVFLTPEEERLHGWKQALSIEVTAQIAMKLGFPGEFKQVLYDWSIRDTFLREKTEGMDAYYWPRSNGKTSAYLIDEAALKKGEVEHHQIQRAHISVMPRNFLYEQMKEVVRRYREAN